MKLHWVLLLCTLALFLGCDSAPNNAGDPGSTDTAGASDPTTPAAGNSGHFGAVISVAELKESLGDENIRILDLGPKKEAYDKGHIPGAVYVDWVKDITDSAQSERYNLLDKTAMESLLSRLGIKEDTCVVLYDDLDSRVSMRMYWSLFYYGHDDIHVLDGGRPAWVAAEGELTADVPEVAATEYVIKEERSAHAADMEFIASQLGKDSAAFIDGRPVAQYSGAEPGKVFHTGTPHKNKGHIPGAVNIFWKDNFNEDGTFKSKEELAALYQPVESAETTVTYCNEGLHAVPGWFVLTQLLGREGVRVYDDSMCEWANSDQETEITAESDEQE